MGASGHRGNGVHRIGSRHRAARPDGSTRGDVRRIRARAGALIARRLAWGKGRCWSMLGLGLLAGAFLQTPLRAQVRDTLPKKDTIRIPTAPTLADSLLRDSLAKRDSILRERIRADTIRSPLAHAPPGATTTRGGWIASPAAGAYLGDARRVRVFYDGFEMPALDPRAGNVLDLTQVSLWSAEDAVVEQAPDEVRVYLRSWRVRTTNPETRTDVNTGDQQTNMYRGFYGRRFRNGAAFQFGAQQYGTTPPTLFGSASDQTSV